MKKGIIIVISSLMFLFTGCDASSLSSSTTLSETSQSQSTYWEDLYPSSKETAQLITFDEVVCDFIQENDIDYVKITIPSEGFYTIVLESKFPALIIYWTSDGDSGGIDGINVMTEYEEHFYAGTYIFEISFDDDSFTPVERFYSFYITEKRG